MGRRANWQAAGHPDVVFSAAFSRDGKPIVTASQDKTARLWDTETSNQIGEPLKGHADVEFSAVFSRDGKRIVTCPYRKPKIADRERESANTRCR